jgi:hypothetical protein
MIVVIRFDPDSIRSPCSNSRNIKMSVYNARLSMRVWLPVSMMGSRVDVLKRRAEESQHKGEACLDRHCETHY